MQTENIKPTQSPILLVQKTTEAKTGTKKVFNKTNICSESRNSNYHETSLSHIWHNSSNNFAQICELMFQDSAIASDLSLGQTKIRYMVNFELGSYHRDKFMKTVIPEKAVCPKFVSSFDEPLNKVST